MLEWKESIQIPDGKHKGTITKVIEKTDPYNYIDLMIKLHDHDVELKYGSPANLTVNSKLGRLMQTFGENFQKGKGYEIKDLENVFLNKVVDFMVITKKTKDGKEFAEIVEDSLKPFNVSNVAT